jgi:hypothetical protein
MFIFYNFTSIHIRNNVLGLDFDEKKNLVFRRFRYLNFCQTTKKIVSAFSTVLTSQKNDVFTAILYRAGISLR